MMLLLRRVLAGLLDLVLILGLSVGMFLLGQQVFGVDMPPRYWNYLDYVVDIVNQRPDITGLAFGSLAVAGAVYTGLGVFLRGSLGLFLVGLGLGPVNNRFLGWLRLYCRFWVFFAGILLAGIVFSWLIWTQGRAGPHDLLCGFRLDLRNETEQRDEEDTHNNDPDGD